MTGLETHVKGLPAVLRRALLSGYAAAVAIFVVTESVALAVKSQSDPISSSTIILFGVLVSAITLGSRPSLLTAALTVIFYDYFTIPPDNSFQISSLSEVIVLLTFPVIFLLTGGLAERAHDPAKKAQAGQVAIHILYNASRKIAAAWDEQYIRSLFARHVAPTVRAPTIAWRSKESFIESAGAVASPEALRAAAQELRPVNRATYCRPILVGEFAFRSTQILNWA